MRAKKIICSLLFRKPYHAGIAYMIFINNFCMKYTIPDWDLGALKPLVYEVSD